MIQKEVQQFTSEFSQLQQYQIKLNPSCKQTQKKEQFYLLHSEPMYFPIMKSLNQTHKLIHHGCLVVFELNSQLLSVIVFHAGEETMLYRGGVKKSDLSQVNKVREDGYTVEKLFREIVEANEQVIEEFSANRLVIRIGSQKMPKTSNDNKPKETPTVTIPLTPTKLTEKQSLSYVKDYHLTKEQSFKQEILKLKSQIYSLMTQLEHVTGLIRSQSVQAKNARLEIKELKREIEGLRSKERKSSMDFGVECKLGSEGEEQDPNISELNSKVKKMTQNIKKDLTTNPITNPHQPKTISIFWQQQLMKENLQPNTCQIQNIQLLRKKNKLPRTSSESYINSSRLSGGMEKTDRLYRMDSSIWKASVVQLV